MLESESLIEEFYNTRIKDKYPLTLEQTRQMVNAPFSYLKTLFYQKGWPELRLKYFGVFRPAPGNVKKLLISKKKRFVAGGITKEKYDQFYDLAHAYLDRIQQYPQQPDEQEQNEEDE